MRGRSGQAIDGGGGHARCFGCCLRLFRKGDSGEWMVDSWEGERAGLKPAPTGMGRGRTGMGRAYGDGAGRAYDDGAGVLVIPSSLPCHSERSEESKAAASENDRDVRTTALDSSSLSLLRMTMGARPVIPSVARNLGACVGERPRRAGDGLRFFVAALLRMTMGARPVIPSVARNLGGGAGGAYYPVAGVAAELGELDVPCVAAGGAVDGDDHDHGGGTGEAGGLVLCPG